MLKHKMITINNITEAYTVLLKYKLDDDWQRRCSSSVPVHMRLDGGDSNHEEHEHREGHHAEAQQDGSLFPNARHQLLAPNSLLPGTFDTSVSLFFLGRHPVDELPVSHAHTQNDEGPSGPPFRISQSGFTCYCGHLSKAATHRREYAPGQDGRFESLTSFSTSHKQQYLPLNLRSPRHFVTLTFIKNTFSPQHFITTRSFCLNQAIQILHISSLPRPLEFLKAEFFGFVFFFCKVALRPENSAAESRMYAGTKLPAQNLNEKPSET